MEQIFNSFCSPLAHCATTHVICINKMINSKIINIAANTGVIKTYTKIIHVNVIDDRPKGQNISLVA